MKAVAGQSISVKFSVSSDPCWGEVSEHTLRKEKSEVLTKSYEISKDQITFHKVTLEDSGTYIISCENSAGTGSTSFVLEVAPTKGNRVLTIVTCLEVLVSFSSTNLPSG